MRSGIPAAFFVSMLGKSSSEISRYSGIDTLVGTFDQVDEIHKFYLTGCLYYSPPLHLPKAFGGHFNIDGRVMRFAKTGAEKLGMQLR